MTDKVAFKTRVTNWAMRLKVSPRQIRIQKMTRKWGSCSTKGYVTFAADLLEEDRRFQDHVIAHELLHLRIPNHGRLFRATLKAHGVDVGRINTKKLEVRGLTSAIRKARSRF